MTIKAEVVKDSVSKSGKRITTFLLQYPRFIHSEFMTHRAFSRNSSSSRAIPFEKQVEAIRRDLAQPTEYRANKSGMQAGEALNERVQNACQFLWKEAALKAIQFATDLHLFGVHKQYSSRILEPFMHITVVVTATDYDNFFALRYHEMAQPEIYELAAAMWEAYSGSKPTRRETGDWHLPFVDDDEYQSTKDNGEDIFRLIKKSVACCARTSYKNHDNSDVTDEQNEALYNRLLASTPKHASPAEHQAIAAHDAETRSGNFQGWLQYRQALEDEHITSFSGPSDNS
ncbi:THY1 Predicted alternative thymidylate synthase [uncultured Caudovirales phage]|uniref:THY1 Predicted alternative thymidylate synthase n=1 Tax=uncultured Caudovirales phage TaxID=2100421 RepID=A0A6J7WVS3_9CAUD|nr:THY1 Predicted alternative thymidylate synthase [uncultured Caudovirales phage]